MSENLFRDHVQSVLGAAPDEILSDGKIHRFADDSSRSKSKAGWYAFHLHPAPRGSFGTNRDGEIHHWHSGERSQPKTPDEIAARESAKREKQILDSTLKAGAAVEAQKLVESATVGDHPYLKNKRISDAPINDGDVIVSIEDIHGTACNVQRINSDGKWFLSGGRIQGCFHRIGDLEKAKRIVICEGFATGQSIHKATRLPVVCTMNCGNLDAVVAAVVDHHKKTEILIAADNDAWTKGNPGVIKGTKAAKSIKARFTVPVFEKPEKGQTDFNDLQCAEGLETVTGQLDQAWHLQPEEFTVDEVIEIVTGLSKRDRALQRSNWSAYLGLKVSELDALMKISEQPEGTEPEITAVEPWPDKVEGADLLRELVDLVQRYIMLSDHESVAWALWIVHRYVYEDARALTPILNIQSATKRCGKSQLLRLTKCVVLRPKLSAGISGPAIYRTIEIEKPTLLVDEADNVVSSDKMDLLAVINSGIEPDAVVTKCVGDDLTPKDFSAYCAKVLAGIGQRIDTLEDRSISIVLRRKSQTKKLERVRRVQAEDIRRRLQRWADDNQTEVSARYMSGKTNLPEVLNDRQQDCFEILLVVADCAGGEWPAVARTAAINICGQLDNVQSLPEMLISDLYRYHVEQEAPRETSANLCEYLNGLKESPWHDLRRGNGIDQRRLADMLKGFGLHSKDIRTVTGSGSLKGYDFDQFGDIFKAYAASGATERDNATSTENIEEPCRGSVADVADKIAERDKRDTAATTKPNTNGSCRVDADVAAKTGGEPKTKEFTF